LLGRASSSASLWILCRPHGDIFVLSLLCAAGCSGLLHWQTAMAMLVAFLLLSSESYLATYSLGCFEMSQGIFGPTEIRILLIIGNLALLRSPYRYCSGTGIAVRVGGTIAAAAMLAMAITVAVRIRRSLSAGAVAMKALVRWCKFNLSGLWDGGAVGALAVLSNWRLGTICMRPRGA